MADFKLPDPKKNSGRVMGLGLLTAVLLVGWKYLVPILAKMAWDTVSLAVAALIAGVLGYILLSKTFWTRLNIIMQALGSMLFGWFIEMNPFTILELQLDQSEKDRQELFKQAGKLKAQEASLKESLQTESDNMKLAARKMELCKQKLAANPLDEQTSYDLQSSTNEFVNSKDFIDKVGPVAGDISRLVNIADRAYRKSGYSLADARSTVKKQRATYEAVTAGSNAMSKALRAFTGSPEMNKAGEVALNKLRADVADKIGTIKNCIAETSRIMNAGDLKDAAKVSLAAENMEKLNIDSKFDYVAQTASTGTMPEPQTNKWLETLK